MPIEIGDILDPRLLDNSKVHAARWNGEKQPLDVFLTDPDEWISWNRWRGARNEFNEEYICSFIQFYPEEFTWLFGGFFKVIGRRDDAHAESYDIEAVSVGADLIGRLKLIGVKTPVSRAVIPRGRAFKPDTFFRLVEVSELLKERYEGEVFRGYHHCSLDFPMLEIVFKQSRSDWKSALRHISGVYLISDKATGKQYVGSAYGEGGVWSRWGQYVSTGHGWNKELVGLASTMGIDYLRENFRLTLIENLPFNAEKNYVIGRENYWKNAILSREHGYNAN